MSISTKAKVFLWSFLIIITIGFGSLAGALFGLLRDLPDLKGLEDYTPGVVTTVYSDNDQVVAEFFQERRVLLPFEKIPPQFIQALLAAEDVDFYQHWGINTKGILRAFIMNIRAGHVVQGGSTLTQQLAKVLFLTPERTLTRKLKEFMLAMQIEKKYTKNEILQMYCNQIYLGSGSYGLESAARTYFGKSVSELKLNQFALVAGLPKGPELYSPFNSQDRALIRMQYVLRRMREEEFITKKEFEAALIAPLKLRVKGSGKQLAPHFSEMVRQYLEQKYGVDMLYRKGLKVYTTLNVDFQIAAERAVIEGLDELKARHKFIREKKLIPEAALISLEQDSGNIKAMVGGASFARSKFNRAVQAKRQPGSAFKTIIYTAALDDGFTPASIILDEPIAIKNAATGREWRPANFDQEFLGPVTVRKALQDSRNVVTIKLLEQLGAKTVIDYARRLGIESFLHEYLSLSLGTSEVSLWELTGAYQVIANQGVRVEPNYIRYITDKEGKFLEENIPVSRRVLSAQTSYLVTSLLRGVVQHGTGWRARDLGRPAAGKTGTTDDYKDAWFMGFVPQLTTGVWVGFDRKQRLGNMETGSRAASPIWVKFMQKAITHYPIEDFKVPEGIVFVDIDAQTGLLATPLCEDVIKEAFRQGTEPVESCKVSHQPEGATPTDQPETFPDEDKAESVLQEE